MAVRDRRSACRLLALKTDGRCLRRTGGKVLVALCWLGSLALMATAQPERVSSIVIGLTTIAALDRILARGSDLMAGVWTGAGVSGWRVAPGRNRIARNRRDRSSRIRLFRGEAIAAPVLVAMGWSWWVLKVAPPEAQRAALTLPLTQAPAWSLGVLGVLVPLAMLLVAACVSGREPSGPRRVGTLGSLIYVMGWLQATGACLIAGTIIPGLRARRVKMAALAGLAGSRGSGHRATALVRRRTRRASLENGRWRSRPLSQSAWTPHW